MTKKNLILAFESSCDETSVAVIEDGEKIRQMWLQLKLIVIKDSAELCQKWLAVTTLSKSQFVLMRR